MATGYEKKKMPVQRDPTHPVWVGNLHESVTESELKQPFSGFGVVTSCVIMRDKMGQSKLFGYVNFAQKEIAERAAKKLAGYKFYDRPIKTKGPSSLKKEGHLKKAINYRPLTDCSFFLDGNTCKNGNKCPYRHYDEVTQDICEMWLQKKCLNLYCPKRHPPLKQGRTASQDSLLLSRSSSGSHASLDFSDSSENLDIELMNIESDDDSCDYSDLKERVITPPSPGFTPPSTPPHTIAEQSTKQSNVSPNPRSPLSAMKGVTIRETKPLSIASTQSFSASEDEDSDSSDALSGHYPYEIDEDEDDEFNISGQPESFTRLMSLEIKRTKGVEEEEEAVGEEEEVGLLHSSQSIEQVKPKEKSAAAVHPTMAKPIQLEPVGLFWDIENCPVPITKSAFSIANKMRKELFQGKREAEFMCVCDITKERKDVMDDLQKAHVTLVHVNAIAKNAADDKLRQSMRKFANTYLPPATVVLISGDINFSPELNDLRHVHNITIVLMHNACATEALKVCAHKTILFDEFVTDVDAPKKQIPLIPATVYVQGLPNMEVGKLRNRLSRLADNCGGKVLKVDRASGTARVLFRNEDWAIKAQKRMNGEDVYGHRIRVELEAPPHPQPPPFPTGPPTVRPHIIPGPGHYPVPPFGPPHPLFNPPCPPRFTHYGLMQPPVPQQPRFFPPPQPQVITKPSVVPMESTKFLVKGIKVKSDKEHAKIISQFTEIRLAVKVKCNRPEIIWSKFSEICLLTELDFQSTAEVKGEQLILTKLKQGNLPSKIAIKFVNSCVTDINNECRRRNITWIATTLTGEQLEEIRVCSNVIELLRKYEKHWSLWTQFKNSYGQVYQSALSEMMIQNTCQGVVEIVGASDDKDEVIVFTELSPVVYVKSTPTLKVNVCKLLQSQPQNRIKLMEFVESYKNAYGALPTPTKKTRQHLQEVLHSFPEIVIRGIKPANIVVELREKSPQHVSAVVGMQKKKLEDVTKEFVELLSATPGYQMPLSIIQQEHQTYFHKSIRVSDILPGETGMRRLLSLCPGIKMKKAPTGSKLGTIVYLENPPPFLVTPPVNASTANSSSIIPEEKVEKFKQELLEVLSSTPGNALEVCRIPEEFTHLFKRPFALADYGGVRKVSQLLQLIPDVVKVSGEGNNKVVELVQTPESLKTDCERKFEELLYNMNGHQTTLDRFLYEYERYYGKKLSNYCGHAKLINLLEDMNTIIEIMGSGAQRVICLLPLRVFACELRSILVKYPQGLLLTQIVPEYKGMYKKEFDAKFYGKKKLIQVLEAIPDVVMLTGEGARRVAHLKKLVPKTSIAIATRVPTPAMEQARQVFLDQVTCLLLDCAGHKMTLEALTTSYYATFKNQINLNQLGYSSVNEAVKELPNVKVSGQGASLEIQLLTATVVEPKKSRRKRQSSLGETEQKSQSPITKTPSLQGISLQADPLQTMTTQPELLQREPILTEVLQTEPSQAGPMQTEPLQTDKTQTNSGEQIKHDSVNEEELKGFSIKMSESTCLRLCSEIHRLLLSHPEHAMTLSELCEAFEKTFDPSNPQLKDLLYCINTYGGKKSPHRFMITKPAPDIVLVSLVPSDALWKLSKDIQYLFVYRPDVNFTMSLEDMRALYLECHVHKLNPLVYAHDRVEKLLKHKNIKTVIKFDEQNSCIALSMKARYEVFSLLACELLFRKGEECMSMDLFMEHYRHYFGIPLLLEQLGMETLESLVLINEISPFIKVVSEPQPYLTLTSRGLFCEQLRHLLTAHNGQIGLDMLPTLFLSMFHKPQDPNIYNWIRKPLRQANHVIHLAAEDLVIWAPTGHPYPNTRMEEQSFIAPDYLKADDDELMSVPEELYAHYRQMVEDPLPDSITLDFIDEDLLKAVSQGSGAEEETISKTKAHSNHTVETAIDDNVVSPDENCIPDNLSVAHDRSLNPALGLDHGQFAGMAPEAVLELMKEDIRSTSDTQSKVKLMDTYFEYFGELSAREIERVEGPPKPRSKNKRKLELACHFQGQPMSEPPSVVEVVPEQSEDNDSFPPENETLVIPQASVDTLLDSPMSGPTEWPNL